MVILLKDAKLKYGEIVNGKWVNESKWMVVYKPPQWFQDKVLNSASGKPCKSIYLNKDMLKPLDLALADIKALGLDSELKTFDGCFMIRSVRGDPNSPSTHSYGLAIDFNAKDNPLGGVVQFSEQFLNCFKSHGFACGANFKRKDGMHFSFAWE